MYTRFCAALARLCLQVGVLGLVLLIVAVLYQVIGRYVFNDTPTWAESGAVLLVLYVTMLGMAVGVRDAGHIGLESLLVLAPESPSLEDGVAHPCHGADLWLGDGLQLHRIGTKRVGLQNPNPWFVRGFQIRSACHGGRIDCFVFSRTHHGPVAW